MARSRPSVPTTSNLPPGRPAPHPEIDRLLCPLHTMRVATVSRADPAPIHRVLGPLGEKAREVLIGREENLFLTGSSQAVPACCGAGRVDRSTTSGSETFTSSADGASGQILNHVANKPLAIFRVTWLTAPHRRVELASFFVGTQIGTQIAKIFIRLTACADPNERKVGPISATKSARSKSSLSIMMTRL